MKDRLVIWAENEKEEKVMLGIQLLAAENKIEILIFPDDEVTESFEKNMMDKWRLGEEVELPAKYERIERELSMSESLLPDNLKTKDTDLINRAKTEWNFVVLSQKLSQEFKKELEEIKERIEGLNEYSKDYWDELKTFWSKVQTQIKDKTLLWQHAKDIKEVTNGLFDKLKSLRKKFEEELSQKSEQYKEEFGSTLQTVREKIDADARLKPLFEDLKALQKKFWETPFVSKHRTELKKQFDQTFRLIKEKMFGGEAPSGRSPVDRLKNRLSGLLNAIDRMENSIKKDKRELEFQQRKIDQTDGQLEMQIRQAKIQVIQERIASKSTKLADMYKTKEEVEKRLEAAEKRQARLEEEKRRKEEIKKAEKEVKEKIASEIKGKNLSEEEALKLQKAAEELAEAKAAKPEAEKSAGTKAMDEAVDIAEKIADGVSEAVEDIVDSVKAVAEVLEEKIEDFLKSKEE